MLEETRQVWLVSPSAGRCGQQVGGACLPSDPLDSASCNAFVMGPMWSFIYFSMPQFFGVGQCELEVALMSPCLHKCAETYGTERAICFIERSNVAVEL